MNATDSPDLLELKDLYQTIKSEIEQKLVTFENVWKHACEEDLFCELAFCIFTPQSNARQCWKAIELLKENECIFRDCADNISRKLKIVRFRNNKARHLLHARELFSRNGRINMRALLCDKEEVFEKREWLVAHIKGIGYKEASHFLRNIGFGESIAILDRHILRNLVHYKVIDSIPKSLTFKRYLSIEEKMNCFTQDIGIPLSHLDLLYWYKGTGELFK